jgi:effector-binding domain-containing protein
MSCTIVTVERQLTAVVKARVPFAKIPDAQRSARAAVNAALSSLDAVPTSRPCTRFRTPASGALEMEIGTIVSRPFTAKGEVVPSDLPAGRAAHFLLKGPFDGMPGAWQTLFDWCKAEKLDLAGINWEIYMPWEGVDPAKLETDLYALLAQN